MQRYSNHAGPAEAHEQASCASTADDVAVLRPGSVPGIQVPEDCCFPDDGRHIWDIHMGRLGRLGPAGGRGGWVAARCMLIISSNN